MVCMCQSKDNLWKSVPSPCHVAPGIESMSSGLVASVSAHLMYLSLSHTTQAYSPCPPSLYCVCLSWGTHIMMLRCRGERPASRDGFSPSTVVSRDGTQACAAGVVSTVLPVLGDLN